MALLVLNSSADLPDYLLYDNPYSSTTSFNEMESVCELVAECAMDIPNSFPEKSNDDSNREQFKKVTCLKIIECAPGLRIISQTAPVGYHTLYLTNNLSDFIRDITPPPPQHS